MQSPYACAILAVRSGGGGAGQPHTYTERYNVHLHVVASQPYFKIRLACETNRELERSNRDSDTFTRLRM